MGNLDEVILPVETEVTFKVTLISADEIASFRFLSKGLLERKVTIRASCFLHLK